MKTTRKTISLFFSAACLSAFALAACTTDSGTDPVIPGGNDSLHVQAAFLRSLGDTVFRNNCSGCHGVKGEGSHGPVLANSNYFMNNRQTIINLVLRGNLTEPYFLDTLVINGREVLGGGMPSWHATLSNKEIASVLTYLRSVLNDSTVVTCSGENDCTKVARTPSAMAMDTVAVWEVKAVRDSLRANNIISP